MPEDVYSHISSNSNQSDPSISKLAKLEARMAGKPPSAHVQAPWHSGHTALGHGEHLKISVESDEDDDDDEDSEVGFLIRPNPQKLKAYAGGEEILSNQIPGSGRSNLVDVHEHNLCDEMCKKRGWGRGPSKHATKRAARNEQSSVTLLPVQDTLNGHMDLSAVKRDELEVFASKNKSLEEELVKVRRDYAECQQSNQQLEKDLKEQQEQEQQRQQKYMKILSDLLIEVASSERQEARMRLRQDIVRLGNVSVVRAGTVISEGWEDGQAFKDIQAHLRSLMDQRNVVEKHRKSLKKGKADRDGSEGDHTILEEEFMLQEEMCKSRLVSIKREEEAVLRDRDRYELERARHLREMRRIKDEDSSRFNNFPILKKRYAVLNLLGKGGFSEVFKAYDLVDHRYVACKIHSLNVQWNEEKKQSYIRHAIRECNIHKKLVHPHIVHLWDTFEIDHNTFCTVLEYCSGKDLDAVLKATPVIPEKEARCILLQLFSGLVYMNCRPQRIIHYDLKPGNVLFDHLGVAKMTDFGLSKVLEEEAGSLGMELTSQGAGTYWYLPPECFEVHKTPLISSKVDVWSVGVLFYQMLYGRRPFGHGQTQERILREDTIIKANKVEFPGKPSVSNEAKEFIRRCLTYNQVERPDVLAAAQDPYLQNNKGKA